MGFSEHLRTVRVSLCLIFTREIQVNIRHFITAKTKECLKGDVKPFLGIGCAALGTYCVRKVCTTLITLGHIEGCVLTVRVGTAVMGRERVDLGDTRHKRYDGRAHRATGAYQIAVLQRVLHQPLGRHIDHIIMAIDNIIQLGFHTLCDQLRRIVTVQAVHLTIDKLLQIFHGVLDLRRKQVVRYGA